MGKLQADAVRTIKEICGRYKDERTPLMMILSDIQKEYGYIPLEVQEIVSEETGSVSVAVDGMLKRHLSADTCEKLLRNELITDDGTKSGSWLTNLLRVKIDGEKNDHQ